MAKTTTVSTGTTIAATGTSPDTAVSVDSAWTTVECVNNVEVDGVVENDEDGLRFKVVEKFLAGNKYPIFFFINTYQCFRIFMLSQYVCRPWPVKYIILTYMNNGHIYFCIACIGV